MGIEFFLLRLTAYIFSHLFILSVSKRVISLMYNILWLGYLSFKLKSIY